MRVQILFLNPSGWKQLRTWCPTLPLAVVPRGRLRRGKSDFATAPGSCKTATQRKILPSPNQKNNPHCFFVVAPTVFHDHARASDPLALKMVRHRKRKSNGLCAQHPQFGHRHFKRRVRDDRRTCAVVRGQRALARAPHDFSTMFFHYFHQVDGTSWRLTLAPVCGGEPLAASWFARTFCVTFVCVHFRLLFWHRLLLAGSAPFSQTIFHSLFLMGLALLCFSICLLLLLVSLAERRHVVRTPRSDGNLSIPSIRSCNCERPLSLYFRRHRHLRCILS